MFCSFHSNGWNLKWEISNPCDEKAKKFVEKFGCQFLQLAKMENDSKNEKRENLEHGTLLSVHSQIHAHVFDMYQHGVHACDYSREKYIHKVVFRSHPYSTVCGTGPRKSALKIFDDFR